MLCSLRSIPGLAVLAVAVCLPNRAVAGGPAPSDATGCPSGAVCDSSLGVALVPPAGWQLIPSGHYPPHVLVWFAEPPLGLDYNVRLLIGPDGTTSDRDDTRAAATDATRLVSGYRSIHPTRYPVHYGGAPGVLVRGLPGGPGPDAFIILAHHGALYSIVAPGATLAPDQRQALASLRFIPSIGPFPSANPPTPMGQPSHRTIPGGIFAQSTLTLTPRNGLHGDAHTYSLWFNVRSQRPWLLTYSVPCEAGKARLVVDIRNTSGRVVDRVLHRRGRAPRVTQMEEMAGGVFRLDVTSRCSHWRVTVSGIAP